MYEFLWGIYLVVEYQCHRECLWSTLVHNAKRFPMWLYQFIFLPVEYKSPYCFTTLTILDIVHCFNFTHTGIYAIISH